MTRQATIAERLLLRLSVCGIALLVTVAAPRAAEEPAHSAELDAAIIRQAKRNGVPEKLVRRIVMRESRYNPSARNRSFWGLMQISYPTAKSMGFKGTPKDLLNPFVNLTYAVPYLANAFIIAGKREDAAVRLYASGYYKTAKERGLLSVLRTAETKPVNGEVDAPVEMAFAPPPPAPSYGVFGALFGPGQAAAPAPETQTAYNAPDVASYQAASSQLASTSLPASASDAGRSASIGAPVRATGAPEASVAMAADKTAAPLLPKKWLQDGGVSNIARGEQRIEHVAAFDKTTGSGTHRKVAQTHSRKNTNFAAIDAPAAAQAYTAPGGQDAALAQTESQAAIQQATSGPQADPSATGAPERVSAEPQPAAKTTPAREHAKATHANRSAQTRSAQKDRGDGKTRVAKDDSQTKAAPKHVKAKKTAETVAAERPDDGQPRQTDQ